MAVDVAQAIQDLIQRILGDRETALQYAEDPEGTLAAQGVTDGDLSGLDMFQLVSETCGNVPGLQNYGPSTSGGGGGASSPPPPSSTGQSVDQVMQHLNHVTYVAYEGDETVTNVIDESTNIDQSQNVNVDAEGDIYGDISVDSHDSNVNATGDGSAAADEGTAVSGDEAAVADDGGIAVSGDGSAASEYGPATAGDENLVNTGTNYGQQNTGDEAAQGTAYGDLVQNTGDDAAQAVADGGNVNQNTGEFTGIQAGDDANVSGGALSFGEGDAANAEGVTVSEGGALSQGDGGASGYKSEDNSTEVGDVSVEVNDVDAYNSQVQTEQGSGDADATQVDDVNAGVLPRTVSGPEEEIREVDVAEEA